MDFACEDTTIGVVLTAIAAVVLVAFHAKSSIFHPSAGKYHGDTSLALLSSFKPAKIYVGPKSLALRSSFNATPVYMGVKSLSVLSSFEPFQRPPAVRPRKYYHIIGTIFIVICIVWWLVDRLLKKCRPTSRPNSVPPNSPGPFDTPSGQDTGDVSHQSTSSHSGDFTSNETGEETSGDIEENISVSTSEDPEHDGDNTLQKETTDAPNNDGNLDHNVTDASTDNDVLGTPSAATELPTTGMPVSLEHTGFPTSTIGQIPAAKPLFSTNSAKTMNTAIASAPNPLATVFHDMHSSSSIPGRSYSSGMEASDALAGREREDVEVPVPKEERDCAESYDLGTEKEEAVAASQEHFKHAKGGICAVNEKQEDDKEDKEHSERQDHREHKNVTAFVEDADTAAMGKATNAEEHNSGQSTRETLDANAGTSTVGDSRVSEVFAEDPPLNDSTASAHSSAPSERNVGGMEVRSNNGSSAPHYRSIAEPRKRLASEIFRSRYQRWKSTIPTRPKLNRVSFLSAEQRELLDNFQESMDYISPSEAAKSREVQPPPGLFEELSPIELSPMEPDIPTYTAGEDLKVADSQVAVRTSSFDPSEPSSIGREAYSIE